MARLGNHWSDGEVTVLPHYRLFITEAALRKEQKRLGQDQESDDWPAAACVLTYKGATNTTRPLCYVCLNRRRGVSLLQERAMLVHEAVHVWQRAVDWMAEREPSAEFEAYAIQRIAQDLMQQFDELRKRKRK